VQLPDGEEGVLVEEVGDEVAVLPDDPQLQGPGPVDVLGAEEFDPVSLLLPVDERTVEIGRLGKLLRVVGGGAERVAPAAERLEPPCFLAVPRVDGP
jgi:hypothetical protein